ncbi:hypothetical protein J3E73DRAFT_260209 [Bipolaris maydis]|nr:hypothetical protein J3E73DRAFT_260209 [Bipolaris maydis]
MSFTCIHASHVLFLCDLSHVTEAGAIVPLYYASMHTRNPFILCESSQLHRQLRSAMRDWVEKELMPVLEDCEASAQIPDAIYQKAAVAGVLMPAASDAWIPQEWRGKYPVIEGIAAHQWNGFHDFILHDEFGRVGGIGFENGLLGGATLCLPLSKSTARRPSNKLSSQSCYLVKDVSRLQSPNQQQAQTYKAFKQTFNHPRKKVALSSKGPKNGSRAACGFTLIVVPLSDRVSRRHITMSGSGTAGAAFVEFDQAEVPIQMIVGSVHERLFIGMQALRWSRVAHMARQVESLHSWLESLIYQFGALSKPDQDLITAGPTATFKAHAGLVLEYIVREAVQIVGEIGLTRGGQGEKPRGSGGT